jgi:hypothetical protein
MKKKSKFVFGAALLVIALLFSACSSPANSETTSLYKVTVSKTGEGDIQVEPTQGPVGTPVTIRANPAGGQRLTELKVDGVERTGDGPWEITLNGNVTVTAVFEPVPANNFTVTIATLQNGYITASPQYGPVGTEITLTISPNADAGYGLQAGSLKYNDGTTDVLITGTTFILPAVNVTVTAIFETKTAEQLIEVGTEALAAQKFDTAIDAFESAFKKDPTNKEAIVYSSLGKLASIAKDPKVRDLMRERLGFTGYPGTIDNLITTDWMETYTNESLVWSYYENGEWHRWYNPEDEWDARFLNRYGLAPKAGYYYEQQLSQTEYTLVRAATEKVTGPLNSYYDEERGDEVYWYDYHPIYDYWEPGYYYWDWMNGGIVVFVSGERRIGQLDSYYDGDLGVTGNWHDSDPGGGGRGSGYYWERDWTYRLGSETPRYDSWTEKLPGLSKPGWFTETGMYKDNLTSAGLLQASQWPLLFYANLVDKNQNGLNELLDGILSSVFGSSFEVAAARFADLPYERYIELDEDIIEAFGLTGIFEGDDIYVGVAELELLFSAVRIFKATLEWVAAYDWNTDISFLRTDWAAIESIGDLSPKNLPFVNNFMKDRSNGMMAKSKTDFTTALAAAVRVYEHLISANSKLPAAYIDGLKDYGWLKDGSSKLNTAIQNGDNFYVQRYASGNSYDNSPYDAEIGINMGKLFTPGQLAIDQLITIESSGNAPQFYAFGGDDSQGVPVTSKAQMNSLDESHIIGFRLKLTRLKEVFVVGFEGYESTLDLPLLPAQIGKDLYGLYHK